MRSTTTKAFDVVYKESNEGEVVLGLGLALPAGLTFRGSCTSVKTLGNDTSPGNLNILPKVECPNHISLLQYLGGS